MVQPCPECGQTRRHKLSCNALRRARHDRSNDALAVTFDAPDNGTTYTGGGCNDTTTSGGYTPTGGDTTCASGGDAA